MNTKDNIQKKVEAAFNTIESIEEVKVSPFFKDKTMQRLFSEKEDIRTAWSWFTPKLQLATLACIVVLNIMAFTQTDTEVNEDTIEDFATTYELSTNEDTLTLN